MPGERATASLSAEKDLVARALRNDEVAIRAIVSQNNRRLFRLARSILKDDAEAEDVVQECYFRAFSRLGDFHGEARLSTWLTRIVINEACGRLRHRRTSADLESSNVEQTLTDAQIIPFPLPSQLDPERSMAQREIAQILERAIDALPQPFRVVLVARLVEEMSVEQTAELLGLRPETVKTRLHRARKLLRAALDREVGSLFTDLFPFAGRRCQRMADAVIVRLRRTAPFIA
jgi:RNA polymerase sigma-70 factor (ECF subfamily)